MSSKKYVLNIDGTITKTTVSEEGVTTINNNFSAGSATEDQIGKFNNLEKLRTNGPLKIAPLTALPITGLSNSSVTSDKDNLLYDKSFGSEEDYALYGKYYNQFNSIFGDDDAHKVYAEELEMLAGFDVNSIGYANTEGQVDLIKFSFILDYVLESIIYIIVAEAVTRTLANYKNTLYDYFYDLLNYPKFNLTSNVEPVAYFLLGLNEFINSDPKIAALMEEQKMTRLSLSAGSFANPSSLQTLLLINFADTIINLSKIEHNRILLLIRKFQKESYWHKRVLYKAKEESAENFIDKFFIEFSQYYFKFIIERMHIGRIVWRRAIKDRPIEITQQNRLSEERNLLSKKMLLTTEQNKKKISSDGTFTGDYESKYLWRQEDSRDEGNNTFSITALPQLLKTNTYIKKVVMQNRKLKQNFDDSDEGKNYLEQKRLSAETLKLLEDYLDNEYMPFYFHDLRTNEILAFHAFIDTISDSFSPEYSSLTGYGRIDDVKHYVKTTRTINTTFSLVAYNQDDHDLMWYQINKLVSMVYPQWSKGIRKTKLGKNANSPHAFPFTQMPTASPLIRLRVGDVITSNYSKENLTRLHVHGKKIGRQKRSTAEKGLGNKSNARRDSQVNTPRILKSEYTQYRFETNALKYAFPIYVHQSMSSKSGRSNRQNADYLSDKKPITKIQYDSLSDENKKTFVIPETPESKKFKNKFKKASGKLKTLDGEIVDLRGSKPPQPSGNFYRYRVNIKELVNNEYYVVYLIDKKGKKISKEFYLHKDEVITYTNKEYVNVAGKKEVDAVRGGKINNPFTAAYETSKGLGLAGFITNLDVNYNESTWQTERKGSRAPTFVKITVAFAPVHDIPPGLDHLGEMRAPVYNVGSINRKMFRTPYEDIDN